MTKRIDDTFARLSAENKAGFVAYFMGGDPDFDTSLEIMKGLPEAGADIIELGMPFTDPAADGPVIELAGLRSLKAKTNMGSILKMASSSWAMPILSIIWAIPNLRRPQKLPA